MPRRRLLLAGAGALVLRQAVAAEPAPLVLGTTQPEDSVSGRWLRLVHGEAFRRVGVPMVIRTYPSLRLSLLVHNGEVDGDLARAREYGEEHPNLVRVDAMVANATLALYAARPMAIDSLEAVAKAGHRVVYTRGAVLCERALRKALPTERVIDANDDPQAMRLLLARRVDLLCTTTAELGTLMELPDFRHVRGVQQVLTLGSSPFYLFLDKRHAALAPALAAALNAMRAEGLMVRYRQEVRPPGPLPSSAQRP